MLRMQRISKSFGSVHANRSIDLEVAPGRIVGLLGENGSGKTTLMNILFGIVSPDAGTITFKDRPLIGHAPRQAIAAGVGMIHQHFMLVPAMTVTENVMLGWEATGRWLHPSAVAKQIRDSSTTYGLGLDPDARVELLPLGAQQRVEIVKAVLRGAELLVLDEPTSSLSPPEVANLLRILRHLRDEGRSVIFISHKLGEVLEICDEVVVLRDEVGNDEAFGPGGAGGTVDRGADIPADHHAGELVTIDAGRLDTARDLAVAEHDDLVTDLQHLAELVRDEDHRPALVTKVAQDP